MLKGIFANFRYKLVALLVALLLWGVSNSSSSIERGFDVPMRLTGIPDDLVVTWRSADEVNVRVTGSRAALRTLSAAEMEYVIQVEGAKPGTLTLDVDPSAALDLPRGARIVSRSPSRVEVELAPRGSKAVRVRPDVTGDPAEGFVVAGVEAEPARVRISGPRSEVLRLNEVMTETIDVRGATADLERETKLSLTERHIQQEEPTPIRVRVLVRPLAEVEAEREAAEAAEAAARAAKTRRGASRRGGEGEKRR